MITCIGIGPNDPELITVKALRAIENADLIIGLKNQSEDIIKYYELEDKTIMLEYNEHEMFIDYAIQYRDENLVKFYNGDPSLYSEMFLFIHNLKCMNIDFEIIPGVTSAFYASALLKMEYTIPSFINRDARSLLITSYWSNPKFGTQIKGSPNVVIYMTKQENLRNMCYELSSVYGNSKKCIVFTQKRNGYLDYEIITDTMTIEELKDYTICGHNNMIIISHSLDSIKETNKIITDTKEY
jgi:precorrin-4 methylase